MKKVGFATIFLLLVGSLCWLQASGQVSNPPLSNRCVSVTGSGTSIVFSSLPSTTDLVFTLEGLTFTYGGTNSGYLNLNLNGDSTSGDYHWIAGLVTGTNSTSGLSSQSSGGITTAFQIGLSSALSVTVPFSGHLYISGANSATLTPKTVEGVYSDYVGGANPINTLRYSGSWTPSVAAAITSATFSVTGTGNTIAGTIIACPANPWN